MKVILSLAIFFSAFTVLASSYNVKYKIVNVNGVSGADEQRVKEGIDFFSQLLQRHCNIKLQSTIETSQLNSSSAKFVYEYTWSPLRVQPGLDYFFRYFQKSVYEVNTRFNLTQPANAVTIFVTNDLGHCGFAFPDVQLNDDESKQRNSNSNLNREVLPKIRNRVLLASRSSNMMDCANSSRMVAHELSHIFIQDNPAHFCYDDIAKKNLPCEDDNILATQKAVYPPHHGGFPGKPFPPGDGSMGPDEPHYVPATGTFITSHQCQSIKSTIQNFAAELK